jgi:hypothetical protein
MFAGNLLEVVRVLLMGEMGEKEELNRSKRGGWERIYAHVDRADEMPKSGNN